jgi:hypothetical protein
MPAAAGGGDQFKEDLAHVKSAKEDAMYMHECMTKACDDTTKTCKNDVPTGSAARPHRRISRQAPPAAAGGDHPTRMDISSDGPSSGQRPVLSTGEETEVGKCHKKTIDTKENECGVLPKCCRNAFNV